MKSCNSAKRIISNFRWVRPSIILRVHSWIIWGPTICFRRRVKWGRYKTRRHMVCRVKSRKGYIIKLVHLLRRALWWLEDSTVAPNSTFLGRILGCRLLQVERETWNRTKARVDNRAARPDQKFASLISQLHRTSETGANKTSREVGSHPSTANEAALKSPRLTTPSSLPRSWKRRRTTFSPRCKRILSIKIWSHMPSASKVALKILPSSTRSGNCLSRRSKFDF